MENCRHNWQYTQGCDKLVKGVLYATAADFPFIVDIPVDDRKDVIDVLADLDVNDWVQQWETNLVVNSQRFLRTTQNFVLSNEVPLEHNHTVFIESDLVFPAPNALIKRLLWKKGRQHEHKGNVLVIKHKLLQSSHDVMAPIFSFLFSLHLRSLLR